MDDALDALTLCLAFGPGAGWSPEDSPALLDPSITARGWLAMDDGELRRRLIPEAQRARLLDPSTRRAAQHELTLGRDLGDELVWRGHDAWPVALETIPDAPFALWARGDISLLRERGVAVVGPRAATPYGRHAATTFATAIAGAGLVVTSGLARGVDAAAHRATIHVGRPTIAVLGSGLGRIYPKEHGGLVTEILDEGGLVLSEAPPEMAARPPLFPRRNRLLVALSRGVLVVEAARRSGALLTAAWAMRYDRPVWAVPGPFSSPQSEGCHLLIRDGAFLTDSPASLLKDLGLAKHEDAPSWRFRCANQAAIFEVLRRGPRPLDALVTELAIPRGEILVALRELELAERIERDEGDGYRLC